MRVFGSIKDIIKDKNTVLTLGTFDGIHPGHLRIIEKVIEHSNKKGCRNLVITFHPHPRAVLSKDSDVKLLTTPEEKRVLLEKNGIQNLLTINFTKEFAAVSAEEFVLDYLINGTGISEIVLGHDHQFGKGRNGNVDLLRKIGKEFGFSVMEVDAFFVNNEVVSSTKIRNAIKEGNITYANTLLGRNYSFTGVVVGGDKRGRELGFPTANIKLSSTDKLLPAIGVYAVFFLVNGKKYNGLLSIGKRPTFYSEGELVTEVFIYDFNQNIYGENVTVELIELLRVEEKYNSAEELISQMNKDKENGLKVFKKLNN